jgi:glycosyltransferase involved in cell wall biosynthesis
VNRDLLGYDFSSADLAKNKAIMEEWNAISRRMISSVNWFLPDYHSPYAGGIHTVLRFAEAFSREGILNRIIIFDGPYHRDVSAIASEIRSLFPRLDRLEVLVNPPEIPESTICIATFWPTAYVALKFNDTQGKYYFIQDFEPLFYPAGPYYGLAEATYRFGFLGIANGPRLKEIYRNQYGGKAEHFFPTPDTNLFYPSPDQPRLKISRIFFYARPAMERNAFNLGILALERLKRAHPDLEIVTAGWDLTEYEMPIPIRNYGLLSLKETAELYRSCDAGLVFMFTKHPSYIPGELMASGCVVITNRNPDNSWLLRDRENCLLTEPTVSSIIETFQLAMTDHDLRRRIVKKGLETVRQTNWESETRRIINFIIGQ